MVLKSDIENVFKDQQIFLFEHQKTVTREYLPKFTILGNQIEVISGIRRCGKSTLMRQIILTYYKNVAYFNFEDSRIFGFEISDFQKLNEVMGDNYEAYFFDEIQNIQNWELYIRQLHDRGKKIFITGSNASLLSKELGTRLTGRHIRHELFPFSFPEFLQFKKLENNVESLETYISLGGFPEFLQTENKEVLQNLLKDIVFRDISIRHGIRNTQVLMDLTLFLLSNIGKETSYNSLKKTFNMGSAVTISDYIAWLEDSYVMFLLPRFSWSIKNTSVNPRKVYAVDTGLVNANTLSFSKDLGRLLENCIYLFLKRKGYQLYYFRENKECDFVVFEEKVCKQLIQVCEIVNNDNLKRETEGLLEAMDFFKMTEGYIITKNQSDTLVFGNKTIYLLAANKFME
jgi:hypothetical protein